MGSSGISFNDDDNVASVVGGGEEEGGSSGVVGFITSLLRNKFGYQDEGIVGGDDGEDDEGGNKEEVVSVITNDESVGGNQGDVGITTNDVSSSKSRVDSSTLKMVSKEETIATSISIATSSSSINSNNKNRTKRRPAMAHVISISDTRHPVHNNLPRSSSSSRRMKSNIHNYQKWTFSRIIGTIIWIGLLIPILEVGIREVSRRYQLGSLLRRRIRMMRRRVLLHRGFSGGGENVHIL